MPPNALQHFLAHEPLVKQLPQLWDAAQLHAMAAALPDAPHIVRVNLQGCRTKAHVLAALQQQLALPAHFGHNWDALFDCLLELGAAQGLTLLLIDHMPSASACQSDALIACIEDAAAEREGSQAELRCVYACAAAHTV